jgi:hypothetical protein
LSSSEILLLLVADPDGVLDAIGGHRHVVDLRCQYIDGATDTDNYERIKRNVLNAAGSGRTVAVAIGGDPLVGVTWHKRLCSSVSTNIEVKLISGISSFNSMTKQLGIDPLENGSILVDANRLFLFSYQLNPSFDVYIYHVCSIGTRRTHYTNPAKQNALEYLKSKLLKTYHENHPALLLRAGNDNEARHNATVGSLESFLPVLDFSSSIFCQREIRKK